MAIKSGAFIKQLFAATSALGDAAINSDATMEIEGYEGLYLLIKQFPWPELTPGGEIEVPMPMGAARWQPQQLKTHQQGGITFIETVEGHVQTMIDNINFESGARFNAKVYEGTPTDNKRVLQLYDCMLQLEPIDRDTENRGQIMLITGTIFYNFFGADS